MTETSISKKKRVAKNTLMLYVRMIFTMLISLYTSRVVLEQLGVNDYGIYNVVGGIVSMFSIVSGSMTSAISRFITYELGRENLCNLRNIFCCAISIQLILGIVVLLLIETLGVWFLNDKMNIDSNRIIAANWVLQFTAVTFIVNMISVPYNACIIAHEKMSVFAYISILEVILKMTVAFLLFVRIFDSLIYYAFLIMTVSIIIRCVYGFYCKKRFEECVFSFRIDKNIFKTMIGFSGWNFIGSTSGILKDQGINILLNLFFGSSINAARGLAVQVNTAVSGFSSNFMLALNPQIIKSFAVNDQLYLYTLVIQGARLALYMLAFLSLPIILEAPRLLNIWLVDVPAYAVAFTRLTLGVSMLESISLPLQYANQATGHIRNYQLIVGGIQLLNLPIAYMCLRIGWSPISVYVVAFVLGFIALLARLIILHKTICLPSYKFIREVLMKGSLVCGIGSLLPVILYIYLRDTWITFVLLIPISWIWCGIIFYLLGCSHREKLKIREISFSIIRKLR